MEILNVSAKTLRNQMKIHKTLCFKAVLGSQQNWKEGAEISHIYLSPHTHSVLYYQLPNQLGTFVTIGKPTLIYNKHQKSNVCNRVHSVLHTLGLYKSMTYNDHYSIT